jgi:HK97 family phage major capsid protein
MPATQDLEKDIISLRKQLREVEADQASARAAADKMVADIREAGANPFDGDNFAKVDEAYKRADELADERSGLNTRLVRALEIAGERSEQRKDSEERREARAILGPIETRAALRFIESPEYKSLRDSGVLDMAQARVNSMPVEAMTRDELKDVLRLRTTVDNTAGSGGGLIWSDRTGIVVPIPQRRVRLLDVITVGQTNTDTVDYATETTHTDAAAETAYGTAAPESAYGWTHASTTVRRIPHFVPATKGSLADAGQLQTTLESFLVAGVKRRLEAEVWNGDGTGQNLTGILQNGSLLSQARSTDTRWDAVHKAVTQIRINLLDQGEPGYIVMSPNDFQSIVLEKDADGNYVNQRGPVEPGSIWGLTPIVTPLAADGTPLVGDFAWAMLWLRSGVTVAASDSHQDFFIKGLVALLAEMRAAFAVLQPKAFCKVTSF